MEQSFKKKSVVLMVILSIVTYGIYIPIWFLKGMAALNNLKSKLKVKKAYFIVVLVLAIISLLLLVPPLMFGVSSSIGQMVDKIDSAVNLMFGIAILAVSFDIKRILEDHFGIKLSGIATFFFTIFYLQYKINELIDSGKTSI